MDFKVGGELPTPVLQDTNGLLFCLPKAKRFINLIINIIFKKLQQPGVPLTSGPGSEDGRFKSYIYSAVGAVEATTFTLHL